MQALLLSLVLVGIEAPGANSQALAEIRETRCDQPVPAVIIVAEGSSGWQGETANKIVGELKAALGSCQALQVVRFDAEPAGQADFTVEGANRDLVMLKPRTPMRDAMETGFTRLAAAESSRTMVVMAHEQFYPTAVSTGGLFKSAQISETTVHTIHLASSRDDGGVFRRLGRTLKNGVVWLVEALITEDRRYSARDTSRLLKRMADATGGKACVAADEPSGIACVDAIAAEIASRTL